MRIWPEIITGLYNVFLWPSNSHKNSKNPAIITFITNLLWLLFLSLEHISPEIHFSKWEGSCHCTSYRPESDISLEILGVNCHISSCGDAYKMHSIHSFYVYLFIQISCNNKEELKQHVVQTDLNNISLLIGSLRPTSSSHWSLQTSLQALATNWFIVLRGCILLTQCSDVLLYTGLHKMIFKHLKGVLELWIRS